MGTLARKRGRPAGITPPRDVVVWEPARCPRCGSHDRTRITATTIQWFEGEYHGVAYNCIVRQWTKCGMCGQARVQRSYQTRKKERE